MLIKNKSFVYVGSLLFLLFLAPFAYFYSDLSVINFTETNIAASDSLNTDTTFVVSDSLKTERKALIVDTVLVEKISYSFQGERIDSSLFLKQVLDSLGNIVKEFSYQTEKSKIAEFTYGKKNELLKKVEYDLVSRNLLRTITHSYDENGNEVSSVSTDGTGAKLEERSMKYNSNGKKIEMQVQSSFFDDGPYNYLYTYTGSTVEEKAYANTGLVVDEWTHTYNEQGKKTRMEFLISGSSSRIYVYTYDSTQSMKRMVVTDADGQVEIEQVFEYDENNRLRLIVETNNLDVQKNEFRYTYIFKK